MPRYVIEQDRPIWVRQVYEVDAKSKEDVEDVLGSGDYEFLGFSLRDAVGSVDAIAVSCKQTNDTPEMKHPCNQPDPEPVVEAARAVLNNLIDADAYGPCECDAESTSADFPRDADGDPWYSDCWALRQALDAYDGEEREKR